MTLIIKGDTIFPRKIPNLNQILFNGVRIFEFLNPKIRKENDKNNDQSLISFWYWMGHKETIKKNIKKTIPKLLFDPILILLFFRLN